MSIALGPLLGCGTSGDSLFLGNGEGGSASSLDPTGGGASTHHAGGSTAHGGSTSSSAPAGGGGDDPSGAGGGGLGGSSGEGGSQECHPPVAGGVCDTFPACGCPANKKCTITEDATGVTVCGSFGSGSLYDACDTDDDCGRKLQCVGGACKPYCGSQSDCPGEGRECIQVNWWDGFVTTPIPGDHVCSAGCDPVDPAACGTNAMCVFADDGSTDCTGPAGTGVGWVFCQSFADCAAGYTCLSDGTCAPFCRVGFPGDCPGQSCTGLDLFFDGAEYGGCE